MSNCKQWSIAIKLETGKELSLTGDEESTGFLWRHFSDLYDRGLLDIVNFYIYPTLESEPKITYPSFLL